ncbi:MAG: RsmB/NOP family class I SAM-dependent RNA methyltransferase [Candidatus Hodarchaeales archaeon]
MNGLADLDEYLKLMEVASKIITHYEINQISLRNAMKEFKKFNKKDDVVHYSQVHAIVFETVRFQNVLNRLVHQEIQSKLSEKLQRNIRNLLRIIVYLLVFAPETSLSQYWKGSSQILLKNLDQENNTTIYSDFYEYLQTWQLSMLLDSISDEEEKISIQYIHPTWLVRDLRKFYGHNTTIDILKANNKTLPVYLRLNLLKYSKETVMRKLAEEEVECSHDSDLKDIIRINSTKKPLPRLSSFREDLYYMQTKGSSLVSHILEPKEDEKILDACAAPGGKTTHLATLSNDLGVIVAIDNNKRRMIELKRKILHYSINSVKPLLFDLRTGNPFKIFFDKILLDAPCSGSGTFSSRPDSKWRIDRHQVKWISNLQYSLLSNVSKMLKKDSKAFIVYSTCSLLPIENEDVIEKFLLNHPEFELKPQSLIIGSPSPKFPLAQRLMPHINETEGFSIFKIGWKNFN